MLELLGLVVIVVCLIIVFIWGAVISYGGGLVFGSKSCLIFGILLMVGSGFGLHATYEYSPYQVVHVESTKK